MINIPINTLRKPGGANDLAILDALQLLERRAVPGWITVKQLSEMWGITQSQVSRRMVGIRSLGPLKVLAERGRYFVADIRDTRAWHEAAMERTRARRRRQALAKARTPHVSEASIRAAQAARWQAAVTLCRKKLT